MQLTQVLATTAALIAPSLAAKAALALPAGYHWSVEHWIANWTSSGSTYDFNITGEFSSPYPGFKAHCNGTDTGYFSSCKLLEAVSTSGRPSVSASIEPRPEFSGWHSDSTTLNVSLQFAVNASITYNVTTSVRVFYYDADQPPKGHFNITDSFNVTEVAKEDTVAVSR